MAARPPRREASSPRSGNRIPPQSGACGPVQESTLRHLSVVVMLAAVLLPPAHAQDSNEDKLNRDAFVRVFRAHDPTLSVDIGRVYVKQAALIEARDLLYRKGRDAGLARSRWNLTTPEWQQAERALIEGIDALIEVQVADPAWLDRAWMELATETLNAGGAEEIAVHFGSGGGALQRRVIEWFVGELTLQYYTFTDRLKYGVPGSEEEMLKLHRTTVGIQEHFEPIYDLTEYPDTMRFASRDPGVKYMKMMVMQGVHVIHTHLEQVADQARAGIRARAALADRFVAQVRDATPMGN